MSSTSILVVEDFAPFRDLLCAMLGKTQDLQVVCAVGDGIEGVRKAEELQPELILLDISLPSLNGIAAAQQICKIAPKSKIIFVTMDSSAGVVREAFRLGAWGYVVKKYAARELLAAIAAVQRNIRFVGSGIDGFQPTDTLEPSTSG